MNVRTLCFIVLGFGLAGGAQAEDRYWKINSQDQGIKKGQKNIIRSLPSAVFWKTRTVGDKTEVYEICKGVGRTEEKLGDATGSNEKGWVLPSGDDALTIQVETKGKKAGKLSIKHKDGKEWASGFRVEPVTCDAQSGLPSDMKRWVGKENVFAAANTLKEKLIAELTESGVEFDESASEAELKKIALTSGLHHLESARDDLLQVTRPVTPTPGKPATSAKVPTGTLMCKTAPMTEKSVRDLTDSPALAINTNLWPGNLLRGKQLAEGKFTPIGVKNGRSGGRLTVVGLNFEPGSKYSIDVDQMSFANVTQAIKDLTSQKVLSTESTSTFNASQVYSQDQLAFAMGVDGRFQNVSFSAAMKIDTNSSKNYVLARFTQIYYTIDYEDPEDSYAVFADGDKFIDRDRIVGSFNKDGTINHDQSNAPLYVKTVSYGRQLYFLASSTESSTAVQAALEGAYGQKEGGSPYVAANASMSYDSVMKNTEVAYFTLGGNSVAAVQPIKAKNSQSMYQAVKEFIADAGSAQFGPDSQGMPVAYSLNYLTSQDRASLGYATSYDQTNCEVVPTDYYSFIVELQCIDDDAAVYVKDPDTGQEEPAYQGSRTPKEVNLDLFMEPKDKNYTLRISDYNIAGGWCADYTIKRQKKTSKAFRPDLFEKDPDSVEVYYLTPENKLSETPVVHRNSGGALVGTRVNHIIKANRVTGLVQSTTN